MESILNSQIPRLLLSCVVMLFVIEGTYCQRFRFQDPSWGNSWGNSIQQCPSRAYCTQETRCARSLRSRPIRACAPPVRGYRSICCIRSERANRPRPVPIENPPLLSAGDQPSPPRQSPPIPNAGDSASTGSNLECGRPRTGRSVVRTVIGGQAALPGEFPWLVNIQATDGTTGAMEPVCTGFLIDNIHVLTAAHCFRYNRNPRNHSTRIGNVDWREGERFDVAHIVLHEDYPLTSRPEQFYNDVAVLTLTRPVSGTPPICLPDARLAAMDLTSQGTTVAGWGRTSTASWDLSNVLMKLSLMPVISNSQCGDIYRQGMGDADYRLQFPRGIDGGFLCAGFLDQELRDACGGDSGGPLMYTMNNRWYAVGIVSFGSGCGRMGYAGGYTRISQYIDWIRRNSS